MVLYWAAIAGYVRLFIYDELVHTSLQEDAVRMLSPLLLAFPAPELSQVGKESEEDAPSAYSSGEPFYSVCDSWSRAPDPPAENYLWHAKYICPHPLLCSAQNWGELGLWGKCCHTQRPAFRDSCLDHFLVALAQEEPFQCDCWSMHTGTLGFLQVMLHELGVRCMGFSRITCQSISTRVPFICALLETLSPAIWSRVRALTVTISLEKLRRSVPAARSWLPEGPPWPPSPRLRAATACRHQQRVLLQRGSLLPLSYTPTLNNIPNRKYWFINY